MIKATEAALKENLLLQVQIQKALSYDAIRECCGYVENGTGSSFSISQDDATGAWMVRVGKATFYEYSFSQAIYSASLGQAKELDTVTEDL
jgi:hypothetical protein|tara:strand:+ start:244 stop:516 length:273 start_codon:yes stop_codon:yes gene_type:complete